MPTILFHYILYAYAFVHVRSCFYIYVTYLGLGTSRHISKWPGQSRLGPSDKCKVNIGNQFVINISDEKVIRILGIGGKGQGYKGKEALYLTGPSCVCVCSVLYCCSSLSNLAAFNILGI